MGGPRKEMNNGSLLHMSVDKPNYITKLACKGVTICVSKHYQRRKISFFPTLVTNLALLYHKAEEKSRQMTDKAKLEHENI